MLGLKAISKLRRMPDAIPTAPSAIVVLVPDARFTPVLLGLPLAFWARRKMEGPSIKTDFFANHGRSFAGRGSGGTGPSEWC